MPGIFDLQQALERRNDDASLPIVYRDVQGNAAKAVLLLKSIPPSPSSPVSATLGAIVRADAVIRTLHSTIKASRSEIRIVNQQGAVLVSSLPTVFPTDQPPGSVRIGNEDYTLLEKETRTFGWNVQVLVPESIIRGRLLINQALIVLGLLASLVLGTGLIIFLLRRNYGPVSRLLETLPAGKDGTWEKDGDEFSYIGKAVFQVQDRFERNKEPLRQNLASRLLRGRRETGISLEDSLSALDLAFATQEFVVYLVQVIHPEDPEQEISHLFHRQLAVSLEALGLVLRGSDENPLVFLINLHALASEQTLHNLQEAVVACGQALREQHGQPELMYASAFSSVVHEVAAIPTAWRQAKTALEYRFVVGGALPFAWDDLKLEKPAALYHYDQERETKLMTVVKAGDAEAAADILSEIFAENSQPGTQILSPLAAQCLVWDLVATLMKALAEISEGDESFTRLFEPVSSLAQSTQWDLVRQGMQNIVRDACQHARELNSHHVAQLKTTANRQFIQQVCAYLQAQFRDPSLNLTKIADAHSLTPAYLSRLFRENTEEGIFDFLNRIRIENAKTLLRTGNGNLQEVGLASGYVDVKTFIRSFRRFTGVTPGKYRETTK
ncbi:MAG: helix-turn-helix transcriptional regulator [Spirochaetales bacterium]